MGTGVALSQVQELLRENAALRQERDRLVQLLAALGQTDAEGAFVSDLASGRRVPSPVASHPTE